MRDMATPLDCLIALVVRQFGVAAACVAPRTAGISPAGMGADGALYLELLDLHRAGAFDPMEAPLAIADTREDPHWRGQAVPSFRFVACWPLHAGGRHLGDLLLADPAPRSPGQFDLAALGDVAAVAAALADAEVRVVETEALRTNERLLSLAIAGSGTGIWDRDVAGETIHYSSGWKAMFGYADDELSDRIEDAYTRLHPADADYVKAAMQAHFDGRTDTYEVKHRLRCKDGSYKWICSRGKVVSRDAEGRALRMIGTTTDLTSVREVSDALQETLELMTALTNEVPGFVFQYRRLPDGRAFFPYASAGIADIYELAAEQAGNDAAGVEQRIHPADRHAYLASLSASAERLVPWHLEYRVLLPRQGLRWRYGNANPRRLPDGSTIWHGFITDATERKRIEAELHEHATTDGLTRLPNRRHFMSQLAADLATLRRTGGPDAAVLMCDLDYFKSINDRFGHEAGDRALCHFAGILRQYLRPGDLAGRIGGEEFAVLLRATDLDDAHAIARRIRHQVAGEPFLDHGQTIAFTVSIGIAPLTAADPDAETALSRSDSALYRAKRSGRNRIERA